MPTPAPGMAGTATTEYMTITDDLELHSSAGTAVDVARPQPVEVAPLDEIGRTHRSGVLASVVVVVRAIGMAFSLVGLAAWASWLVWRVAHIGINLLGLLVLIAECTAFAAALIVTGGLWVATPEWRRDRRSGDRSRALPVLLADALGLGNVLSEAAEQSSIGGDDTGEIAWARRGIRMLGDKPVRVGEATMSSRICDTAWAVVAVDGLRRLASVVLLVVVLFTGRTPFSEPPVARVVLLIAGIAALGIGHTLLSAGHLRPGSRLRWSMASIGAGLGDGVSRSGFPIRWMATIATVVALNIAIALRGISDRWTHGLGPMERDERIAAMALALVLVAAGGMALRRMPRPDLGHYGATRRLEERSVRLLALGLTLLIAGIGFFAGMLPD